MNQQKSNVPIIVGGVVAMLVALVVCGGGALFFVVSIREASENRPPERAEPCVDELVKPTVELRVCPSDGASGVSFTDELGTHRGTLQPNTRIVRLYADRGQSEEVRRRPGHVDARVCVLDGAFVGLVGYVRNTYIRGGTCQ